MEVQQKKTRGRVTKVVLGSQGAEPSEPHPAQQSTAVQVEQQRKRRRTTRAILNSQSAEISQPQCEQQITEDIAREQRSKNMNDRKGKQTSQQPEQIQQQDREEGGDDEDSSYFNTRMGPKIMFQLVQGLTPEQKQAVTDIGFGSLLQLQLCTNESQLVQYLIQKFDVCKSEFILEDDKLHVQEEDIEYTLGIPRGQKEVEVAPKNENNSTPEYRAVLRAWRNRWGIRTGSPITTKMGAVIVSRGDYGDEFKRDFMVLTVSCMMRGYQSRNCNYRVINSLINIGEIKDYNWCSYTYKSLIKSIEEKVKKPERFFIGPMAFILVNSCLY